MYDVIRLAEQFGLPASDRRSGRTVIRYQDRRPSLVFLSHRIMIPQTDGESSTFILLHVLTPFNLGNRVETDFLRVLSHGVLTLKYPDQNCCPRDQRFGAFDATPSLATVTKVSPEVAFLVEIGAVCLTIALLTFHGSSFCFLVHHTLPSAV